MSGTWRKIVFNHLSVCLDVCLPVCQDSDTEDNLKIGLLMRRDLRKYRLGLVNYQKRQYRLGLVSFGLVTFLFFYSRDSKKLKEKLNK